MPMLKPDAARVREPGIAHIPQSSLKWSIRRASSTLVLQDTGLHDMTRPNKVGHRDSGTLEVHGCPFDLKREAGRVNHVSKFLIC
jgi:hypothetical protein